MIGCAGSSSMASACAASLALMDAGEYEAILRSLVGPIDI